MEVVGALLLAKVEAREAIVHVLADVRVHHVDQHGDAHAVRFVDERLERLWVAGARGRRKGVGDVVAKARVVGVLLHGHELHAVEALARDAGEHVAAEVVV